MKLFYLALGGAHAAGYGCAVLDNCPKGTICAIGPNDLYQRGECVPLPSQNVLQRRAEENMLSSMPQAATDALYEARQQRRKQLLKEQMAKKLWEDNYEDEAVSKRVASAIDSLNQMQMRNYIDQISPVETPKRDSVFDEFDNMEKTIEDSMRKIQESMKNEEREIELESAANPGNSNFKSYSMSSSKVNDQPAVVDLQTNDNGKVNSMEEQIGNNGEILSVNTLGPEIMPSPAKRVAAEPMSLDDRDLLAISEEKKAMVLTFGAGGLLCAVLVISGITLYATKKRKTPPLDFPAGDYEQLCRQHFAAKESQEISPTEWNDSKDTFQVPNDELSVEQARALLHASTDEDSLVNAWKNANSSPSDESTNGGGEHPGKDRDPGFLPYEINRFKFKNNEIYYNASNVTLCDESWLLAQSPLPGQLADFWTMIWESQRTALILLSPLQEDGMSQSARFWPNEGAELHGGIEVNLVTEHVWCREFLVRSLYLRHIETGETRTVTLLHYLGWPLNSTPPSAKRLLEFRRKARRAGSPVVICPDGASRSGTYTLIDAVICGYGNGKEPKPSNLLMSLRGQRMKAIKNMNQLNFVTEALSEAAENSLAP